jgi:hypothetical protein
MTRTLARQYHRTHRCSPQAGAGARPESHELVAAATIAPTGYEAAAPLVLKGSFKSRYVDWIICYIKKILHSEGQFLDTKSYDSTILP